MRVFTGENRGFCVCMRDAWVTEEELLLVGWWFSTRVYVDTSGTMQCCCICSCRHGPNSFYTVAYAAHVLMTSWGECKLCTRSLRSVRICYS
mmetsp:Transcript_1299/g.5041  ORF Transcript_1299/g.5041 Transcript_1299/m.5041 type:complete len:92 (+) Transcript_1299:695-970(+)